MINFEDVKVLGCDIDGTLYKPEGIRNYVHRIYDAVSNASPSVASFVRGRLPRASIPLHYNDELARSLSVLRTTLRIFVVTDGYESVAVRKLRELGALPFVDGLICCDKFGHIKDEEYFLELMSRTGLPAQSHVAVGDNLRTDILLPKSLGMKTVKVGGSQSTEEDLWVPQFPDLERYFELARGA